MEKNEIIQNLQGIKLYFAAKLCAEHDDVAKETFRESINTVDCAMNLLKEQQKKIEKLKSKIKEQKERCKGCKKEDKWEKMD